jgi:hypothetical protein
MQEYGVVMRVIGGGGGGEEKQEELRQGIDGKRKQGYEHRYL